MAILHDYDLLDWVGVAFNIGAIANVPKRT
jgi:hypothetical protein